MSAGAGMIFSQGLMRMRSYEDIELAVRTMNWAHQGAGGQPPHETLYAVLMHAAPVLSSMGRPIATQEAVPSHQSTCMHCISVSVWAGLLCCT